MEPRDEVTKIRRGSEDFSRRDLKASVTATEPMTFVSIVSRKDSTPGGRRDTIPALFTRTSIRPWASLIIAAAAAMDSVDVTSIWIGVMVPFIPNPLISAATSSPFWSERDPR